MGPFRLWHHSGKNWKDHWYALTLFGAFSLFLIFFFWDPLFLITGRIFPLFLIFFLFNLCRCRCCWCASCFPFFSFVPLLLEHKISYRSVIMSSTFTVFNPSKPIFTLCAKFDAPLPCRIFLLPDHITVNTFSFVNCYFSHFLEQHSLSWAKSSR